MTEEQAEEAWQQLQREQEEDRQHEVWEVTEQEIEDRAANYFHEECDPLEELR